MTNARQLSMIVFAVWLTFGFAGASIASERASAAPRKRFVNSVGMELVLVKPGSFIMGQQQGGDWDERPEHKVTITGRFYMGVTEVTNAQYEQFDLEHRKLRGKHGFSKSDNEAVVFVSWRQAMDFCKWLSEKEGKSYRLPTEAQWEYACRAGTTSRYNTGNSFPKAYHKKQKEIWELEPVSLVVGVTASNAWGIFDMHGNVEEWCHDWYGPYEKGDQIDPVGRAQGSFRVTRGGSHSTDIAFLRSANRLGTLPDDTSCLIGFRIVEGELPQTRPLSAIETTLNQRNVASGPPVDLREGPDQNEPFFKGPIQYVHVPPGSEGPIYSEHNHDPALVDCPNGDLLAIWYSCRDESGRELCVVASRLRYGTEQWEPASIFWDAPDRNDHAPAMWYDGQETIYHFNGLSIGATWGNMALIMRTSTDSGATWSEARLINPEHGLRHQPVESVFRTSEGYLVLPCDAVTGGTGGTAIHISRDAGKSWTDPGMGRPAPTFSPTKLGHWIAGIHAGVVQLGDGSLMALGRGDNIDGQMTMSISKDMGQNWTYSASGFTPLGSGQRLILRRLSQGPILFVSFTDRRKGLLVRDAKGGTPRVFGMFAALSYDDGKSWPYKRLITAGGLARKIDGGGNTGQFTMDDTHAEPRGYLAATQTPNGLVHLITSKQYYSFNLAWIKQNMAVEKE